MSGEKQGPSKEEINELSREYRGVAKIGAAAEVSHREIDHPGKSKKEIATEADEVATTAIRDFLEDNPVTLPEQEKGETPTDKEAEATEFKISSDNKGHRVATSRHSSATSIREAVHGSDKKIASEGEKKQNTVAEQKERHPDEKIYGIIILEGRLKRKKEVLITEYIKGEKIDYEYDTKGRIVKKTLTGRDGEVARTEISIYGEQDNPVTETTIPYKDGNQEGSVIIIEAKKAGFFLVKEGRGKSKRVKARPYKIIDTGKQKAMWGIKSGKGKIQIPTGREWPEIPTKGESQGTHAGGIEYTSGLLDRSHKREEEINTAHIYQRKGRRLESSKSSKSIRPTKEATSLAKSRRDGVLFPTLTSATRL